MALAAEFVAHQLAAHMNPESEDYRLVMAAVKFDLGPVADVESLARASSGTFMELPAPLCLFQVDMPNGVTFYLAKADEGGAWWRCYSPFGSGDWQGTRAEIFMPHTLPEDNRFAFSPLPPYTVADLDRVPIDDKEGAIQNVYTLASAVEVFSCSNVVQVEHKPPKFINQKRLAKGKVPFFTYRTLHITGDEAPRAGTVATGTKASPRLHLRRGHIRRLADGRRIWIRAMLVGDKSLGMVTKDYAVHAPNR